MPRRRQTALRIDPGDYTQIEERVASGEVKDVSGFIRDAIREKLDENRVSVTIEPEIKEGIRKLVEIGAYDSEESFVKEAVQRHLYLSKDKEMVRDVLFTVFLDDPVFKKAMREFIHEVFVEGFRPPPKQ